MSKTITGVMPIRTVGLTPGHRWCGGLRSVKPAVNNGKGARGLVQGPNSLNASYTHPGRISGRPRKLARDLRNRWLALLSRTFTFELAPTRSPSISVEYDYVDKQSIPTAGLSPASPTALWAAGHRNSPGIPTALDLQEYAEPGRRAGRVGHDLSHQTVSRLLVELGYSLQANRKTLEGQDHPDRDAQFEHINRKVRSLQRRGQPVVSVDTKKKELIGNYKNPGQEWEPRGRPRPVKSKDFPDKVK